MDRKRLTLEELLEGEVAVSLINEPLTAANAIPLRTAQPRSPHADIVLSLTMTEHLLQRLESGVCTADNLHINRRFIV